MPDRITKLYRIARSLRCGVALALALAAVAPAASAQRRRDGQERGAGYARVSREADKSSGFRENPQMLAAFREVVAAPGKSVVRVDCDGRAAALGTVVGADGWVLTKNSQLKEGATPSVVMRDGRTLPAKVIGVDYRYDLAMLKIDATNLAPITWGSSKAAAVGDLLAAPAGMGTTPLAVGVVSVAARAVRYGDLPTTPPENAGYLGIGLEEVGDGARITSVQPESAAAKAGLAVNDIVITLAGTPIIDSETVINTIQRHKPGDVVTITLRRGEREFDLRATLAKRPASLDPEVGRRDFQNKLGSELSDRRGGFPQVLQTDMVLKPTDCGGPLVDLDGKTVGITIARAGRTESYALPAEAVQGLIEGLKTGRAATSKPTTAPTK